ncbi:TetR/AcrR family transcriptional regulator [Xenophilus azovorans]|uniref:TetR/AcrR family transcriptional regulator n=1 Tax=Xenophilus azovorans TaxID=151755 RepID=UPI00068A6F39|nr:TetR/AcrR family transcriptional regulator [Xenophilus azovorans]
MATRTRRPPAAASPWTKPDQRGRQRELKRQAVLQTAARLFNERGFHATSLDDIARQLHVTKPTLYYYVKSKDDILLECVRAALGMMKEGIDAVRESGGRALDQLVACMRIYVDIVMQDFGMCVIRNGEDPLPPPLKKELRRLKAGVDHEFRRLIAAGVEEGSLAPCDPKMAAFMIGGALSWVGRWYRPDGELDPQQIAEQAVALLLGGVLAPAQRRAAARQRKKTQEIPA